jgi:RHS repeat-associated protein
MGRLYATYGVEQSTQTTRFHMNDWLGSRRVDLSPAAIATLTCFNYPYGDGQSCTGPDTDITEHHFTGKMRDAETGNDDFGARYYASNMGRFLTADEFRNDAHLANPQSWNLYAYVHNSPLTLIDPTGEYVVGDGEPKCYEEDAEAKGEQKAGDSQQTRQFVLTDPALLTFAAEGTAQQQTDNTKTSVSTTTYEATPSGVHIVLLGTVTGSDYQDFNWVQTVTTTDPLHGNPANTPYADTDPGQKTPYYWNPTEQTQFEAKGKAQGGSTVFSDAPSRPFSGKPISWHADLSLAGIKKDGSFDRLKSFSYGFTLDAKGVHIQPLVGAP